MAKFAVGQKVLVTGRFGREAIGIIDRLTKTTAVVGKSAYNLDTGHLRGGDGRISELTQEKELEIKAQRVQDTVRKIFPDAHVEPSTLVAVQQTLIQLRNLTSEKTTKESA